MLDLETKSMTKSLQPLYYKHGGCTIKFTSITPRDAQEMWCMLKADGFVKRGQIQVNSEQQLIEGVMLS